MCSPSQQQLQYKTIFSGQISMSIPVTFTIIKRTMIGNIVYWTNCLRTIPSPRFVCEKDAPNCIAIGVCVCVCVKSHKNYASGRTTNERSGPRETGERLQIKRRHCFRGQTLSSSSSSSLSSAPRSLSLRAAWNSFTSCWPHPLLPPENVYVRDLRPVSEGAHQQHQQSALGQLYTTRNRRQLVCKRKLANRNRINRSPTFAILLKIDLFQNYY